MPLSLERVAQIRPHAYTKQNPPTQKGATKP
jgi:hypothetical protein